MARLPTLGEWQRGFLVWLHRHPNAPTVADFLSARHPDVTPGSHDAATAWRAVRALERRGYVKRRQEGRRRIVTLTDQGASVVSELTGEQPTLFQVEGSGPFVPARMFCDSPGCKRVARAFCSKCLPNRLCQAHGLNTRDRQRRFCWVHAGVSPIEVSADERAEG